VREPACDEGEVAPVAHRGQLVVRSAQLLLGGVPVPPDRLDEVAESLAAAHRGFREIAEDLAIGDAFE
jgi:hypothetical protein